MSRTFTIPHSEKIGSVLLIALSIAVFALSAGLPDSHAPGDPGPAFFPRLIAGGIAILALVQLATTVVLDANVRHEVSFDAAVRVSFVIALFGAYVLLLPVVGFLPGSILFLAVLLYYSGERNPAVLLGVSIGLPLALFYVFSGVFNVPLPENAILPISRLLPSIPLLTHPIHPVSVGVS